MKPQRFFHSPWKWIKRNSIHSVKSLDRAPHNVTFTFNEDTDHRSFWGGFFALLIFVYLIYIFAGNIDDILLKKNIVAEPIIKVDPKAQPEKTNFGKGMMFAIGIQELDFRYEKVFNLRFSSTLKVSKPRNRTEIKRNQILQLVPCTPDIWEKLELLEFYRVNQFEQMLCPNPKDTLKLSQRQGYRLQIESCDPESPEPANQSAYIQSLTDAFNGFKNNPDWAKQYEDRYNRVTGDDNFQNNDQNQTDYNAINFDNNIEILINQSTVDLQPLSTPRIGSSPPSYFTAPCYFQYYEKIFKLPRQYRVQFFYVNTIINAEEQQYTKRYVDYQEFLIQLTNDSTLRTEADFYLDSYRVITNNNIFNNLKYRIITRQGFIKVKPIEVHSFIYDPANIANLPNNTNSEKMNNYFTLDIKRSNQIYTVNRSFKTIEGLFKQLGGYLCFFGVILGFFFQFYNQLSFKIEIVSGLYFKEKKQPIQKSSMNYFKFLIYKFWCLLGMICIRPRWNFCEDWQEVQEQHNKLLDIQTLVKKVQHLQKIGKAVLDQDKYYALYLQEPQNLVEESKKFEAQGVYNKLRSKYFSQGEIDQEELMKLRKAIALLQYANPNASLSEEIKPKQINQRNIQDSNQKMSKNQDESQLDVESDMRKFLEQLRDEDDENYIDEEMFISLKKYLEQLKSESKISSVALRIYQAIDPNIKCIFLNEEIPKKQKRQMIAIAPMSHEQSNDSLVIPPKTSSKVLIQDDKKNQKKDEKKK